jgi:hypothetical protein
MNPLTVKQLIEKLQEFDENSIVTAPPKGDYHFREYSAVKDVEQISLYDSESDKDIDAVAIKF